MLLLAKPVQETTEKAELGFKDFDTQAVCVCMCVCRNMLCLPTLIVKCASETAGMVTPSCQLLCNPQTLRALSQAPGFKAAQKRRKNLDTN